MKSSLSSGFLLASSLVTGALSFLPAPFSTSNTKKARTSRTTTEYLSAVALPFFTSHDQHQKEEEEEEEEEGPTSSLFDCLLEEFSLYNGEIVDPYVILGVDNDACRQTIRRRYIELSKQFHPDAILQQQHQQTQHDIVICLRQQEEERRRDQWERVHLSYGILSDHKQRLRYDRTKAMAMGLDAATKTIAEVGRGMMELGKGLWDFGCWGAAQFTLMNNDPKKNNNDNEIVGSATVGRYYF